ncbi:MAG: hypothetical protein AAB016_01190 [candidate division NC10 bacterium]
MRTLRVSLLIFTFIASALASRPVWAQSPTNEELKRELDRKDQQIRQLLERLERVERLVGARPDKPGAPPAVAVPPAAAQAGEAADKEKEAKRIFRVFGTLETEGRWRDNRNIGNKDDGSSSNLYVRRVFVGADVTPADFVVGTLILQSEYVGTSRTNQDGSASATPQVDKATISLGRDDIPVYGVGGFRVQPFGAFYNHLITDPMTQDAYEVKRAGATIGSRLPLWGLDLSATVYQGETQVGKLFEANLFDAGVVRQPTAVGVREERDGLRSFNVTATATPVEQLALGVGYLSEPGGSRRNQTGAVWGALNVWDVTVEAEYMHALARERYWDTNAAALLRASAEERILAAGLAYRLLPDLELAGRYERYWDDDLGLNAGIWRAQDRFSVGASYTLLKRDGFTVKSMLEYRGTDIDHPKGSQAVNWRNELFGKLSISYE